ncbi:MAG TPA: OB-fold nucleic acid binding domain-containing protein [Candidatus Binatia bacterium]|nr:OB-fold nucleic acid binding domain-containing protein [Candidatus Binatia bacterium]
MSIPRLFDGAKRLATGGAVAAFLAAAALAARVRAAGASTVATPAPTATPAHAAATVLPKLFTAESLVQVEGKILRSTRGHPGPVRLEVERADGERVEVLLAPDDVCDQLGLSLRAGEQVRLEGSLFRGRAPIVVASSVIVNGKAVSVRPARKTPAAKGLRVAGEGSPANAPASNATAPARATEGKPK